MRGGKHQMRVKMLIFLLKFSVDQLLILEEL